MVAIYPQRIGFHRGGGGQEPATAYIHLSPDGGWQEYSTLLTPAVFDDDDGAFGRHNGDTDVSFGGHRYDDAGTGGPYSTRMAALICREWPLTKRCRATLSFKFDAATSGERVAVYARAVPAGITLFDARGTAGTGSHHYGTSLIQGYALEITDAGTGFLYEYASDGSRSTVASAAGLTVVAGTTYSMSIEVSADDTPVISCLFNGADPFSGDQTGTAGAADDRGMVGFGLTKTAATAYPLAFSLKGERYTAGAFDTVFLDEFDRAPAALTGTVVPTGGGGQPTASELPHKIFEYGGHHIGAIGSVKIGPWLKDGARRYGPRAGAAGITNTTRRDWLDPLLVPAPAADHTTIAFWRWTSKTGINILAGSVGFGVGVRCSKSAIDGGVPAFTNATGYILRALWGSDPNTAGLAPHFELLRVVAGTETILATRPFFPFAIAENDIHQIGLKVANNGSGHPVLNGYWRRPDGTVVRVVEDLVDDDASKITATGSGALAVAMYGMNGANPMLECTRMEVVPNTVSAPTLATEAESAGAIPHAPEFPERMTDTYQIVQQVSERSYTQSRPRYDDPRRTGDLEWLLETTEADEVVAFLEERIIDRKAFTVSLQGGTHTVVLTTEDLPVERTPGGIVRIGPVAVMEVL